MEAADQTPTVGEAASAETPALVIFGLDDQKKPHGSAFLVSESDLVQKAAALMGMKCFQPRSEEERALVAELPRGRIFASGKAFVPFVASGVFERLRAFADAAATSPHEPNKSERPAPVSPDNVVLASADDTARSQAPHDDDTDLTPGKILLASDEGQDAGFYEAVVVRIEGQTLHLRWLGWPKLPIFLRKRSQTTSPPQKPYW